APGVQREDRRGPEPRPDDLGVCAQEPGGRAAGGHRPGGASGGCALQAPGGRRRLTPVADEVAAARTAPPPAAATSRARPVTAFDSGLLAVALLLELGDLGLQRLELVHEGLEVAAHGRQVAGEVLDAGLDALVDLALPLLERPLAGLEHLGGGGRWGRRFAFAGSMLLALTAQQL